MSATIKIRFCVPLSAREGDWCQLHSNGGAGAVDWQTPASSQRLAMFAGGAGNWGAGLSPAGLARAGLDWPVGAAGAGLAPAGLEPAGLGAVVVEAAHRVETCGEYEFGFKNYDALGNPTDQEPQTIQADVHLRPPRAAGLKLVGYDPAKKILTLTVNSPAEDMAAAAAGAEPGGWEIPSRDND